MEDPWLHTGGREMILRGIIGVAVGAGLSACATAPVVQARGGSFAPVLDGVTYGATVSNGVAGKALTAQGAQPVQGMSVRVSPFAMDQGKRAKDVASLACAQAGGRFNAAAIGGFTAGSWVFEGGCA